MLRHRVTRQDSTLARVTAKSRKLGRLVAIACIGLAAVCAIAVVVRHRPSLGLNRACWIDGKRHKLGEYHRPDLANTGLALYQQAIAELDALDPGQSIDLFWDFSAGRAPAAAVAGPLRDSAHVLDLVHAAADEPYISPVDPLDSQGTLSPHYNSRIREIARRLATKVRFEQTDDPPQALQTSRDGLALAANVMQWGGTHDTHQAVAVAATMQRQSGRALTGGGLSAEDLLRHAEYVRALRQRVPPMRGFLQWELVEIRHTLEYTSRDQAIDAYQQVMAMEAAWHGEAPSDAAVPDGPWEPWRYVAWLEDRYARLSELCEEPLGASAARIEELIGRTPGDADAAHDPVFTVMRPAVQLQAAHSWLKLHALLLGEETMACLEAYHVRKGAYPGTLGELVPDFMPELPPDPWGGGPMRYRREGSAYRLYSVGPDLVDDGGSRERGVTKYHHQRDFVIMPLEPDRHLTPPVTR